MRETESQPHGDSPRCGAAPGNGTDGGIGHLRGGAEHSKHLFKGRCCVSEAVKENSLGPSALYCQPIKGFIPACHLLFPQRLGFHHHKDDWVSVETCANSLPRAWLLKATSDSPQKASGKNKNYWLQQDRRHVGQLDVSVLGRLSSSIPTPLLPRSGDVTTTVEI